MKMSFLTKFNNKYNELFLNRNYLFNIIEKCKLDLIDLTKEEIDLNAKIKNYIAESNFIIKNSEKNLRQVETLYRVFSSEQYLTTKFQKILQSINDVLDSLNNNFENLYNEVNDIMKNRLVDYPDYNKKYTKNNFFYLKNDSLSDYEKDLVENIIPSTENLDWYSIIVADNYLNEPKETLVLSSISKKKSDNNIDRILKSNNTHEVIIFHPGYGTCYYKTNDFYSNSPNRDFETNTPLFPVDIVVNDEFKGEIIDSKLSSQSFLKDIITEKEYNLDSKEDYLQKENSYIEDMKIIFRNNLEDLIQANISQSIVKVKKIEPENNLTAKNFMIRRNVNSSRDIILSNSTNTLLNNNSSNIFYENTVRYDKSNYIDSFIDTNELIQNSTKDITGLDKTFSKISPNIFMHISNRNSNSSPVIFSSNIPDMSSGSLVWNNVSIGDDDVTKYGNIVSDFENSYSFQTTNYRLYKNKVYSILPWDLGIIPTYMMDLYNLNTLKSIDGVFLNGTNIDFSYTDIYGKVKISSFNVDNNDINNLNYLTDNVGNTFLDLCTTDNSGFDDYVFKKYKVLNYFDILNKPFRNLIRTKYYPYSLVKDPAAYKNRPIDYRSTGNLSTFKINLLPNANMDVAQNTTYTSIEAL